jgi:hypothetical protein
MTIYYLQDLDLGWDNVVCMATTRIKCIEEYTDGEVIPQNDEEVDKFLKEHRTLHMDYKFVHE